MRYQGKITSWKDDQGFGFVISNGGGEKAFIHIKAFTGRSRRPLEGDFITYEQTIDEKRRFQATNIRFVGEPVVATGRHKKSYLGSIFALLFASFLAAAVFPGRLPSTILALYMVASLLTFVAYALDKSAAQNNRWRTQESTLHLFGIVGGWPGALLAQNFLRHKSKKQTFQTVFWATVMINCLALGWLLSKLGSVA